MPDSPDQIYDFPYTMKRGNRVILNLLGRYRYTVLPAEQPCKTCGAAQVIHRIEMVEVLDRLQGDANLPLTHSDAKMMTWKISAAHNSGKPICLTPECLEKIKFQCSITAAS